MKPSLFHADILAYSEKSGFFESDIIDTLENILTFCNIAGVLNFFSVNMQTMRFKESISHETIENILMKLHIDNLSKLVDCDKRSKMAFHPDFRRALYHLPPKSPRYLNAWFRSCACKVNLSKNKEFW